MNRKTGIETLGCTKGPWEMNESGLIFGQVSREDDEAPFVADVARDGIHAAASLTQEEQANGRLISAAWLMLEALDQALTALNTAPRFAVPSLDTNSYKIAALCEAAIRETRGA